MSFTFSTFEPPAPMTQEQKEMIERENHYRRLFAEEPTSPEIQDPHVMLVNVFENMDQFNYQEETPEEKAVPKLLTQHRKLGMTGCSIVSKEQFLKDWKEFTMGILDGLDWNNIFIAGGAVLANLAADRSNYNTSDIDIFIYGIHDDEEANNKLRHIHEVVTRNSRSRGDVIRTERAVTILNSYPYRHVQIILRMYKSPAEVLLGFDIDSCTVGYDGTNVWCMPRFIRAMTKRYNLVNVSRRSLTYEQRLYKYSKRGFAVAVPNLDKQKVDASIFQRKLKETQGLAKLLLYDYMAQKQVNGAAPPKRRRGKAVTADDEESSDYNGDVTIPWAPGLQVDQILRALNVKDKRQFFAKLRRNKATGQTASRPTHLFERIFVDAGGLGKIEWIKNNPAYQDYDNGFRRQLMTGSFHPVIDENWEKGAYGGTVQASPGLLSSTPGTYVSSTAASPASKPPQPAVPKATSPAFSPNIFNVKKDKEKKPAAKPLQPADNKLPKQAASRFTEPKPPVASKGSITGVVLASAAGVAEFSKYLAQDSETTSTTTTATTTADDAFAPLPPASPQAGGFSLSAFGPQPGAAFSTPIGSDRSKPVVNAFSSPSKTATSASSAATVPTSTPEQLGAVPSGGFTSEFSLTPTVATNYISFGTAFTQQLPRTGPAVQLGAGTTPAPPVLQPVADSSEPKPASKLMLLIALCFKQGHITAEEKGKLKDLVILRNEMVYAALEVFELDQDLGELVDTFKRICRLQQISGAEVATSL